MSISSPYHGSELVWLIRDLITRHSRYQVITIKYLEDIRPAIRHSDWLILVINWPFQLSNEGKCHFYFFSDVYIVGAFMGLT